MSKKRIIAVLLTAVYVIAASVNALGVLSCDCSAHHLRNVNCCREHHHGCRHHGCRHHGGPLCEAACESENGSGSLTEHCSCTHRHGEEAFYTLFPDDNELLKNIRTLVAEQLRAGGDIRLTADSATAVIFKIAEDIPISAPPLISAGAPRAPSFSA